MRQESATNAALGKIGAVDGDGVDQLWWWRARLHEITQPSSSDSVLVAQLTFATTVFSRFNLAALRSYDSFLQSSSPVHL